MSGCEVCGREMADTHVSPPYGMCSLRWPSSETEHWRLGYERLRTGYGARGLTIKSYEEEIEKLIREKDAAVNDAGADRAMLDEARMAQATAEASRDQMGAALREAETLARSEGRREGLEAAMRLWVLDACGDADCRCAVAADIRRAVTEDMPKAPLNTEPPPDPAPSLLEEAVNIAGRYSRQHHWRAEAKFQKQCDCDICALADSLLSRWRDTVATHRGEASTEESKG